MKKHLVLGIFVLMSTMSVIAQDVIFRSSSDSIQAQVLTVGTIEITYRKWSNLDGPIYSIPVNEVAAIRYANGTYDFFSNKSVETQERNCQHRSLILTRSGNTYYYDNKVMNKQATLEWLQTQNCPTAYEQFSRGLNISKAGWALMATGLMADFVGTILYALSSARNVGFVFMGAGSALEIACIPTIAVGYSKMHQTVNVYNVTCGSTAQIQPYWSVQASHNGIGIAYNF